MSADYLAGLRRAQQIADQIAACAFNSADRVAGAIRREVQWLEDGGKTIGEMADAPEENAA